MPSQPKVRHHEIAATGYSPKDTLVFSANVASDIIQISSLVSSSAALGTASRK